MTHGASPDEWAHFDVLLGLTADLLPVVSNPSAVVSPNSAMKSLGKTPSVYNRQRQVVGLSGWTQKQTKGYEIEQWMREPDYGICLQTRQVRALDVDVDDAEKAESIAFVFSQLCGGNLPLRFRVNSGKRLLAFALEGEFSKRVVKVDGGIIEFLANGQQFIAAGTHPSGARYAWAGGLPDAIPMVSADVFESAWGALTKQYGIADSVTARPRKRGEHIAGVVDDIVDRLDVLAWGKDGQAFIECPWKSAHSMDSGVSETAYFPAGVGGYEQGHFKCLHAGCAARTDDEFLSALGLGAENDFEIVSSEPESKPLPKLQRTKTGAIKKSLPNIVAMLSAPEHFGWCVRFDTFFHRIMVAREGSGAWQPFDDAHSVAMRRFFESEVGAEAIGKEMMNDAVLLAARENHFDTAQTWLNSLRWDGVSRVESFFIDYFGVEDTDYSRACARYTWTALAGRVLQPGVQADMVPVLVGEQGEGKTSAIKAMIPSPEFYAEINLAERDADQSRLMRGKLIGEIAEMRAFNRVEKEAVKAFITRTHEEWVEKYQAFTTVMPRRLVFIGTTNQQQFLDDDTGNRRWLPMLVRKVDVEAIDKARNQLWAEAAALFIAEGVYWQAERFAADAHQQYSIDGVWDDAIERYLNTPDMDDGSSPSTRKKVQVSEILQFGLGFDVRQIKKTDQQVVSGVLRGLGWRRKLERKGSEILRVWVK